MDIDNALKVMNFDIENKEKELIQFVDMGDYGVSSEEKPLLLICNLQSCISLIAYSDKFSYLSHMNVYGENSKNDFIINGINGNFRCTKIEDLFNEILIHKDKITSPVNIGLVLGITPVDTNHICRKILENDLEKLFEKLKAYNIESNRLPNINSYSFILDSRNGNLIHDGVECSNKVTNIPQLVKQSSFELYE